MILKRWLIRNERTRFNAIIDSDFFSRHPSALILFLGEKNGAAGKRCNTGESRRDTTRKGLRIISVSGTVASPDAPVVVSFLVSGKVVQVGPREGEYVQKGQLLAAIDPTDYTLGVQAASAQAGQARIALERARDEYGRMKFLFESRSLAANDFEKFKAAYMSAKQQLDQAVANEKLSQKRLTDASLYSSVSGFISKRAIEPGELASPGHPVFEIVKLDPVEISVGVPETDIHLVRIGQTAALKIPALPGEVFQGAVRVINVSADPGTRTYMTRITVPNPGHTLRIGMVAEARIQGDRRLDLMTLPAEAIVCDPQGATGGLCVLSRSGTRVCQTSGNGNRLRQRDRHQKRPFRQ